MEARSRPPDFKEFLQFLNEEKVEYLLIGGWAVGVHGVIRYTQDMDVWVAIHPDKPADSHHITPNHHFGWPSLTFEAESITVKAEIRSHSTNLSIISTKYVLGD